MTLKKRLYCLVDPEPQGYYAEPGAYAVNLSFECSGDVATDVAEARNAYENFLQVVQGSIKFVSYRVDATGLTAPVSIKTQLPAAALPASNALFTWLTERAKRHDGTESDRFWVATSDSAEVEVDEAGAGSLLRAVQAWNAPVGHYHGLTYVVWRDIETETEADSNVDKPRRVIVPIEGEAPPLVFLGDDERRFNDEQNTLEFKHSLGSKIPSLFCHTVIFGKPEPETDGYPFIDSGYLKVNKEAVALHRLLNGFEQRAASLLAVTPALLPLSGANNPDEDDYKKLFKRDENRKLPAIFTWAAITGLLTQLDVFVIALLRPLSSTRSEGALLAPLITAIIDAINHANADLPLPANPPAPVIARLVVPERRRVADSVCSALRHSPIFAARDEQTPSQLIHALSVAHDLTGPVDSDSKVPRELLLALLDVSDKRPEYPELALNNERYKELRLEIAETPELTLLEKALATVQTRLYSETGAESAIIRLFETSVDPAERDSSVGSVIAKEIDANASEALKKAVGEGWAQYCALLKGIFVNGADAVRHLSGLEFLNAVYANPIWSGENTSKVTAAEVAELISEAEYFQSRLGVLSNKIKYPLFDEISKSLVQVTSASLINSLPLTVLERHLSTAYDAAIRTVGDLSGERQRFVPDLTPQPLPMQIASDVSGDQLHTFLNDFNGIAIAISREDSPGNSRPFAHANLAELTWSGQYSANEILSIHPFLPIVNDGRSHAFIEYHGVPFADTSYAHLLDGPSATEDTNELSRARFYQAGLSSKGPLELPRLAYGCRFGSFAFATTNAGTLPQVLQAESAPWLPGPIGTPDEKYITKTVYQRRTAIGEVELVEGELEKKDETDDEGKTRKFLAVPKERQRINRAISDVVALSSDYPRSSLVACEKGQATLDLFRESDGAGTLLLPSAGQDQFLELCFDATQFSGKGRLFLQVGHGVLDTPDIDSTSPELELTEQVAGASAFTLTLTEDGASVRQDNGPGKDFKFREKKIARCWIRLVLEAVDSACALTFATPEGPKGSRPSSRLLLLTPPSGGWQPEIKAEEVTFKVSTPRVGYLDFQRWMANSTLREAAFGKDALKFVDALEQLYKVRNLSPGLAQFFDRLPDPAVRGISYTLCEADRLVGKVTTTPLVGEVMWGELETIGREFVSLWPAKMNKAIKVLMEGIDSACSFTLTLASGSTWSMAAEINDVKCTVPAGTVAHLSIEALVSEKHFSAPDAKDLAPIHAGLLQYASAKSGNHYAFPLAALCIETMSDDIANRADAFELIKDVISLEAAGSARRYDIVAGVQEPPAEWRLYSHASVHTQQWLYSGRPLYRSLEPRDHAFPGKSGLSAALRVNSDEDVYEFENELFFDRGNADSADSAPKKLEPLPAKTVLHTQTWDSPSATYWRHRFTLRSRYAGALIKGDRREVEAFPALEDNSSEANHLAKTWTMRAVMLADLSRVQLTRPQLRALIPLTTTIGGGTPSVLAVLQEPPLAVGGLAERTTAELKTGFGYGFETGTSSVEILDARKEIGPDPTLTYSAMPAVEAANLALMAEGPIGLTFDARHAAAPAFANSMFSLTPASLNGEPVRALEEHFLGVTLQRHLEPAWLYTPADANSDAVAVNDSAKQRDALRCWWITYELPEIAVEGQNVQLVQADAHVILELKKQDENRVALVMSKAALDGQDGNIEQFVELCALRSTTKIALLHQPLAAGHFGLSIFVARKADIDEGHSGGWLRVASVEWSVPESTSASTQLVLPTQAEPRATAASAATFIAWTRTHRNFANLTLHGGISPRAMASDVVAKVSGTTLSFHFPRNPTSLHLTSSTYATVEPIHRHRHLGFILTHLRGDDGRPVEQFEQHGLFAGKFAQLTGAPKNIDRLNVRLVEIESPAVVLCTRREPAIPLEYHQGVLDLVATGGNNSGAQKVKLFLRLAGTDNHIQQFRSITINIGPVENVSETLRVALEFNQFATLNKGVRLIEIGWSLNQLYIYLVGGNGKRVSKPTTNDQQELAKQLIGERGLMVTIDAPNQPECWCDLSVLHSKATANELDDYAGVMDLRWLFSQDSPDDMAQALQPSAMAIRTEAQARIVSVSPPIPVVDKISE